MLEDKQKEGHHSSPCAGKFRGNNNRQLLKIKGENNTNHPALITLSKGTPQLEQGAACDIRQMALLLM